MMDKFYTVPEVAELLKISRSKMYRLVPSIPHIRIERNIRIRESDLLQWVEDHAVVPSQLMLGDIQILSPPSL
jgi:excisionase family DNA binding protein